MILDDETLHIWLEENSEGTTRRVVAQTRHFRRTFEPQEFVALLRAAWARRQTAGANNNGKTAVSVPKVQFNL